MKSKAPLALMEQMVMVLVFALAAALCLRAFALSDRLSREGEERDRAVVLAQNAAEVCKYSAGDPADMIRLLGGETDGSGWAACYDRELLPTENPEDAAYRVVVSPEVTAQPGLGQARVTVYAADGRQALFALPVAWQEVAHG